MEELPLELIISICNKMNLNDIISLRCVSRKFYYYFLAEKNILQYFKNELFFNLEFSKYYFKLINQVYSISNLYSILPDINYRCIIEYLKLDNLYKEKEDIKFDICSYLLSNKYYLPSTLYYYGKNIFHIDGRQVIYLNDKYRILDKLIFNNISDRSSIHDKITKEYACFIYRRFIVPYYIGINKEETIDFLMLKSRNIYLRKIKYDFVKYNQEDYLTNELSSTTRYCSSTISSSTISSSTISSMTDNYWIIYFPLVKLETKWNLANEKFLLGLLTNITHFCIYRETELPFFGKMLFYGKDNIETGKNLVRQLHYIDCPNIYYKNDKSIIKININDSKNTCPI